MDEQNTYRSVKANLEELNQSVYNLFQQLSTYNQDFTKDVKLNELANHLNEKLYNYKDQTITANDKAKEVLVTLPFEVGRYIVYQDKLYCFCQNRFYILNENTGNWDAQAQLDYDMIDNPDEINYGIFEYNGFLYVTDINMGLYKWNNTSWEVIQNPSGSLNATRIIDAIVFNGELIMCLSTTTEGDRYVFALGQFHIVNNRLFISLNHYGIVEIKPNDADIEKYQEVYLISDGSTDIFYDYFGIAANKNFILEKDNFTYTKNFYMINYHSESGSIEGGLPEQITDYGSYYCYDREIAEGVNSEKYIYFKEPDETITDTSFTKLRASANTVTLFYKGKEIIVGLIKDNKRVIGYVDVDNKKTDYYKVLTLDKIHIGAKDITSKVSIKQMEDGNHQMVTECIMPEGYYKNTKLISNFISEDYAASNIGFTGFVTVPDTVSTEPIVFTLPTSKPIKEILVIRRDSPNGNPNNTAINTWSYYDYNTNIVQRQSSFARAALQEVSGNTFSIGGYNKECTYEYFAIVYSDKELVNDKHTVATVTVGGSDATISIDNVKYLYSNVTNNPVVIPDGSLKLTYGTPSQNWQLIALKKMQDENGKLYNAGDVINTWKYNITYNVILKEV